MALGSSTGDERCLNLLRPRLTAVHSLSLSTGKLASGELVGNGLFTNIGVDTFHWNLPLDGQTARALFGTFSPILVLEPPERERVVDRVASVIETQFGGMFERTCVTILYTALRNAFS